MSSSQEIWCVECRLLFHNGQFGDWQPQRGLIEWDEADAIAAAEEASKEAHGWSDKAEWRAKLYAPALDTDDGDES